MRTWITILLLAVAYIVPVILGLSAFCYAGTLRCQVGQDLTVQEVALPVLVAFVVAGLLAATVGAVLLLVDRLLISRLSRHVGTARIVAGILVGTFPIIIWYVAGVGPRELLYLHVDYLPFAVGGLLAALACSLEKKAT